MSGLHAIIFDFDGVIANSEPLHLKAFQHTLGDAGHVLTAEEYFARYLGYDDVGAFRAFSRDRDLGLNDADISALIVRKGIALQALLHDDSVIFPGALDFIRAAAAAVPVAIASGALRHEIDEIVQGAGVADLFAVIVASGDTPESKPSPAPYTLAFERLCAITGRVLDPSRCVAIEDSRWGLESARAAGLRCVGVTTSYPAHELPGAELIVGSLENLTLPALHQLCSDVTA